MTAPADLAKIVEWLEDAYPGTRNYRHIESFTYDFASIPETAVWEAARAWFNAGERNAPTVSQLRADAASRARARGETDPTATDCDSRGHHGAWAVDDIGDGRREAMCVDCGTTVVRDAHKILTVGERAEQARQGTPREAPPDPIADRIAP